jgi:hypothetical protein
MVVSGTNLCGLLCKNENTKTFFFKLIHGIHLTVPKVGKIIFFSLPGQRYWHQYFKVCYKFIKLHLVIIYRISIGLWLDMIFIQRVVFSIPQPW